MPAYSLCATAKRGTGIKGWMKPPHISQMFNTEVGRYRFTVMPFNITVTGDVFQQKLDECFGHIKNLIVIAWMTSWLLENTTTTKTTIWPSPH